MSRRPAAAAPPDPPSALLAELEQAFHPGALAELLDLAPDQVPERVWENALLGAAREFLGRPGKAFRARLVELACALAGGRGKASEKLALAIEVIHAGSLVVDDIQDRALLRRGGPALHLLVGVPVAINTGNWMYYWPLQLVARAGLAPERELLALRDVNLALLRCHHGQALDLSVHVGGLRRAEVPGVVAATTRLKTGALLELAARLGAHAAGAAPAAVDALGAFGRELGIGLQMLDDLGSVASAARLDKGEEDLSQGRATWPWAWLAERADDLTWMQHIAAQRELEHGPGVTARVRVERLAGELARRVESHGRAVAHERLAAALARLGERFEAPALVAAVRGEIERLEASYG